LLDELRDLYHAELQIAKTLPRLGKAARTPALRDALRHHREETEQQIVRLEEVFNLLGARGTGRKSRATLGLRDEATDLIDAGGSDVVRDAALIAALQRVAHYEMATYGTVIAHARMLGHPPIAQLLEPSLNEEQHINAVLTRIAEQQVNRMAVDVGRYAERSERLVAPDPLPRPLGHEAHHGEHAVHRPPSRDVAEPSSDHTHGSA
jgi:ferritin-like metal-binding protein YciE